MNNDVLKVHTCTPYGPIFFAGDWGQGRSVLVSELIMSGIATSVILTSCLPRFFHKYPVIYHNQSKRPLSSFILTCIVTLHL